MQCHNNMVHHHIFRYAVGIRIRSSLISAIYRKSLRVSPSGKKETTTGEVVNLMSVDVQRLVDL